MPARPFRFRHFGSPRPAAPPGSRRRRSNQRGCVRKSAADLEGSEDRTIELRLGGREISLPGLQYLLHAAMPNFYFHITTAYDILRHNGVPLSKATFLGR